MGTSPAVALAGAAVILVAGVIRVRLFAARRSLWFDEAAVAMNIIERSFGALLLPLDHEQTAAPLFLWGERVAVMLGGNNEWALRALPLLAGLLLPFAMWSVAKRLFSPVEALVAVALVALSPFLIYYANEVKPYGIDALVTTLLFAAALRIREQPGDRGRWLALALGGAVAIGIAIPAPFVLAGVAVFLLARPEVRRAPGFRAHAALTVVAWAVAAGLALLVYLPLMKHDSFIGSFMQHYWGTSFLSNEPPGLKSRVLDAVSAAIRTTFFDKVMWPQQLNMLMLVAVAGAIRIVMTRGLAYAAMLGVPVLLLVCAAALQIYPLGDRLILFAAPITAIALVAGVTWPARLIHGPRQPMMTAVLGALLLVVPIWRAGAAMRNPPGRSETREMIHELVRVRSQSASRPPVWLSAGSVMAWRYYTGATHQPKMDLQPGVPLPQPDSIEPGVLLGKWPQSAEGKAKGDWAMWELNRLHDAGNGCGWMLLSVLESGERELLFDAIRRSNTGIVKSRADTGAELLHVCIPPQASMTTGASSPTTR